METEQRLERLERALRRQRRWLGAAGLALAGALSLGAARAQEAAAPEVPVHEALRARRIDVVDADGRVTCTLTTELQEGRAGAGLLVLRNRAGVSVCRLGSSQGHGALSLHHASGPVACSVGAYADGGSVDLFGPEDTSPSRLWTEGGAGELVLAGGGRVKLRNDDASGVALTSDPEGELQTAVSLGD